MRGRISAQIAACAVRARACAWAAGTGRGHGHGHGHGHTWPRLSYPASPFFFLRVGSPGWWNLRRMYRRSRDSRSAPRWPLIASVSCA